MGTLQLESVEAYREWAKDTWQEIRSWSDEKTGVFVSLQVRYPHAMSQSFRIVRGDARGVTRSTFRSGEEFAFIAFDDAVRELTKQGA